MYFCRALARKNTGLVRQLTELSNKSIAKAFEYAKRGAELGNAELQLSVGLYYEGGNAVKRDYAKAAQWFQKALDNGDERGKSFIDELKKKKKI